MLYRIDHWVMGVCPATYHKLSLGLSSELPVVCWYPFAYFPNSSLADLDVIHAHTWYFGSCIFSVWSQWAVDTAQSTKGWFVPVYVSRLLTATWTEYSCHFPMMRFGKQNRAFSATHYDTFPWTEYSISADAMFCFPCRQFHVKETGRNWHSNYQNMQCCWYSSWT